MFRMAAGLVTILVVIASAAAGQEVQTTERAIPGRYIVVLNDQQVAASAVRPLADALARQHGGRVEHVYEHAIRGFAVTASATAAAALARNPRVRYVEQDSERFIVDDQPNATWGLDRIDQRDRPLSGTYTHTTLAAGIHVYVIDTGIRSTHAEFGGRVSSTGFTAIGDGNGTSDCNGHGTHVAGTIGGATHGVAKGVTLHAVRVLNCSGSGTTSGVIAGVNWVTANHAARAVANMSLGGGASTALDDAVRNSVASGVTYAIAAGNSNANACFSSPARVSEALTVGSSTNTDARSSFSNFGTCVDLFAPGSSIMSAWSTSDTATNTISGTSMAAPHVAGAAALYLALNAAAQPSPATVHAAVVDNATVNRLSGVGTGSPNRLLYSMFGGTPVDSPPSAIFTYSCAGLSCAFDGRGSTDDHGIASYAWNFGDNTGSGDAYITHAYQSGGTFTVTLTVTDTVGQAGVASQSVTIAGGGPCSGCQEYTGTLSGTGDSDIHPGGSYYYTGVWGTHRGWLQGPSTADFDLYLQKWNGWWWSTVARSESATSTEQIAYSGSSGYYRWIVQSYSGSGSYSFWLQRP